jgi:hypothetical protein
MLAPMTWPLAVAPVSKASTTVASAGIIRAMRAAPLRRNDALAIAGTMHRSVGLISRRIASSTSTSRWCTATPSLSCTSASASGSSPSCRTSMGVLRVAAPSAAARSASWSAGRAAGDDAFAGSPMTTRSISAPPS